MRGLQVVKKTLVRNQDQFLVRLPEGMRDRIKAKADRAGMSMNEAIVWCLEQYFPAPATLQDRIDELAKMVAALKDGNELEGQIDEIVDHIDSTLRKVDSGKITASEIFATKVSRLIEEWDKDTIEAANDRPFDDDRYQTHAHLPSPDDREEDLFPDPPSSKKG